MRYLIGSVRKAVARTSFFRKTPQFIGGCASKLRDRHLLNQPGLVLNPTHLAREYAKQVVEHRGVEQAKKRKQLGDVARERHLACVAEDAALRNRLRGEDDAS
ncbi:MAG: hypothetical protein HY699_24910 [Deltaproteobacteria bacterium]|nr:hypothetical protein [Deltaproteobacteria bacterium]